MIRYRCNYCDTCFDEPVAIRHTEFCGEFRRTYFEHLCPICGGDSYERVNECPKCGSPKAESEILCGDCKSSLLRRFTDFADHMTAEEEEQLDAWMDGDTISNRRLWR